jgi:hypothetical protein
MTKGREVKTLDLMPCLRCGKTLELGDSPQTVCSCGATFSTEQVQFYSKPGYYREWLAALSCACGRVDHYTPAGVMIESHRCFRGGVMYMDSPFLNTN